MKKTALYIIVLIAFCSCSEVGDIDDIIITTERFSETIQTLSVDQKSLAFDADGGQQQLAIRSNARWTISSSESWCSVPTSSGSGNSDVTIIAGANPTTEERTATITVSNSERAVTVTVTQKGAEADSGIPGPGDNQPPAW